MKFKVGDMVVIDKYMDYWCAGMTGTIRKISQDCFLPYEVDIPGGCILHFAED